MCTPFLESKPQFNIVCLYINVFQRCSNGQQKLFLSFDCGSLVAMLFLSNSSRLGSFFFFFFFFRIKVPAWDEDFEFGDTILLSSGKLDINGMLMADTLFKKATLHLFITSVGLFVALFSFCPINLVYRLQPKWARPSLGGHVIGGQLRDLGGWFWEDLWWQAQVPLLQLCYQRHSTTHWTYPNSHR